MSDSVEKRHAIYDHLAAMPGGVPVVWPNTTGADEDSATPRYEVEPFARVMRTILLDRTEEHRARIQVTAVVSEATGDTESAPMVQAIIAQFPRGLKIDGADILGTPRELQPIKADGEYRVPVEIRYRYFL